MEDYGGKWMDMVVWSMEGKDSGGKGMEDYGGKWMDMVVWSMEGGGFRREVDGYGGVEEKSNGGGGERIHACAHTHTYTHTHTHTGVGWRGGTIHTTTKQYSTH